MSKAAGRSSTMSLNRVVDLLLEHKIKLDALERVLEETNPLMHELYLGAIENLQARKTAEAPRVLAQIGKSKPAAS